MRTSLLLDAVEHLSGYFCGPGAGNGMDADQEEELRLVGGREGDGESVAGAAAGVRADCSAGFGEGCRRRKFAVHFGSSAMARGLGHAVEYLIDGGLLAEAREFEIRPSHVERGSAPVIAEAGELRPNGVARRRFESEASCDGRDIRGAEVGGEHAEVGVAGMSDGRGEVDVTVSAREPAAGGSAEAGVIGILEIVLLAVG